MFLIDAIILDLDELQQSLRLAWIDLVSMSHSELNCDGNVHVRVQAQIKVQCFFFFLTLSAYIAAFFSHQDGVTIGLEVLLPKEAKLHADASPPLQYDVFLYKAKSYSSSHPTPKAHKSPKRSREPQPADREPLSGRHSTPSRRPPPGFHPSPARHSAPGCYSPHHSPSHFQCVPTSSSSSSTPPHQRRSRGASQASISECPPTGGGHRGGHIRPSPSSPHLTQPPPSPSGVKCSPVSTRSLPPLS